MLTNRTKRYDFVFLLKKAIETSDDLITSDVFLIKSEDYWDKPVVYDLSGLF